MINPGTNPKPEPAIVGEFVANSEAVSFRAFIAWCYIHDLVAISITIPLTFIQPLYDRNGASQE
jgi:hypothetical protein